MAEMITYEEFLEMAMPFAAGPTDHHHAMYDDNLRQLLDDSATFFEKWVTGGRDGGNPWGGDDSFYSVSPDREPDLKGLYEVFDKLGISYWKGRKIEWDVQTGTYSDSGYYGNYTDFTYKWISFDAVYDRLVEFGMAHPREQAPKP